MTRTQLRSASVRGACRLPRDLRGLGLELRPELPQRGRAQVERQAPEGQAEAAARRGHREFQQGLWGQGTWGDVVIQGLGYRNIYALGPFSVDVPVNKPFKVNHKPAGDTKIQVTQGENQVWTWWWVMLLGLWIVTMAKSATENGTYGF